MSRTLNTFYVSIAVVLVVLFSFFFIASAVVAAVPSNDLIEHLAFDEGEGTVASDESVKGNTGILKEGPQWITLTQGFALSFDGVDDYVEVDDDSNLRVSSNFAIAAWIYPETTEKATVLSKNGFNANSIGGYMLSLEDGKITFGARGRDMTTTDVLVEQDEWVHVAVVFDGATSPNTAVYIDGERVHTDSTTSPDKNSVDLLIGRDSDGSYFKGRIDEVILYKRAIDSSEVRMLFQDGIGKKSEVEDEEETTTDTDEVEETEEETPEATPSTEVELLNTLISTLTALIATYQALIEALTN